MLPYCIVDERTGSPKRLMRSPDKHSLDTQNGLTTHSVEAPNGLTDRQYVGTQNGPLRSPEMHVLDIQNGAARSVDRNSTDSPKVTMRGMNKQGSVDTPNGSPKTPTSQNSSGGHTSRRKFLRGLFKRRRSSTREKNSGRTMSPRAAHSQPDVRMCSPTYTPQYEPSYSPQLTPTYSPRHTPLRTALPDLEGVDAPRVHELSESPPGRSFCGMTTCGGSVQSLDITPNFSSDVAVINPSVSITHFSNTLFLFEDMVLSCLLLINYLIN